MTRKRIDPPPTRRGQVTKGCLVCGRSFTGPRRQPTCSRTCGKRLSRVLKYCEQCGAGMMLPPFIARDRRFCSRTCANRAAGDNRVKVASADCQHCRVRFKPKKPDRVTYCSRRCSFVAKRERRLERAWYRKANSIHCYLRRCACGRSFSTLTRKRRFCRKQCRSRAAFELSKRNGSYDRSLAQKRMAYSQAAAGAGGRGVKITIAGRRVTGAQEDFRVYGLGAWSLGF